jgi:hypothetical protein
MSCLPRDQTMHSLRSRLLAAALLTACGCAPAGAASLRAATLTQLRGDIDAAHLLVNACAASAAACDSGKAPEDEQIGTPGKNGGFAQHWFWLRTAMDKAKKAKPAERATQMREAGERLDELTAQCGAPPAAPTEMASARKHVDGVLATPEFHAVSGVSWLDRVAGRFWTAMNSLFNGFGKLGSATPWIGPLLEWVFFLGAGVGLLFFVMRSLARQRLQVRLGGGPVQASVWDRESTDWARHAETMAAAQNWREALHGLYWAAILHLESRRAWRHDPSRTPREYVRLLQPGSVQRDALAGLTRQFERVWYGLDPSSSEEYSTARGLFERLTASAGAGVSGADAGVAA